MASFYFLIFCSIPSNKDTTNWNLITEYSFFRLFKCHSHPVFDLLPCQNISFFLHIFINTIKENHIILLYFSLKPLQLVDIFAKLYLIIKILITYMQAQTINLKSYVSVVSQLVYKACQYAKECAENPNLNKYQKGINDPVTDADYKIQTMLIEGIHSFFPNLKIIGEETTDYKGDIDLKVEDITLENYPEDSESVFEQKVPLNQICVWIDPIDNTKGFIKGNLDCVTILVGLSRNYRAQLGIIGVPYSKNHIESKIEFNPQVIVGSVSGKKAYSSKGYKLWKQIGIPSKNDPPIFSISDSRGLNDKVEQIVSKHSAKMVRVGGSGKKILQVIKGQTDCLLYLSAANHKWDSCSGQAIIIAIGGHFSDADGNPIVYNPDDKNTVNHKGNICASNEIVFKSVITDLNAKL